MDLHPGIHGGLLATPPAGYRYLTRAAEHVFLHGHGRRPFSPVHQGHWAELVRFGAGDELVHSASWPVLGRRHWVVELDDFGYPAYLGRHALSARFRRTFEHAWTEALTRDLRVRTECLVKAYTHQSCGAVIFTNNARVEIPSTSTRVIPYFVAGGGIANVRRTANFTYPVPFASNTASPSGVVPQLRPIITPVVSSSTDLALTIGHLGDLRGVPALVEGLSDAQVENQVYTLWALGSIGDKAAVPHILKKLDSQDPALRRTAA